MRAAIVLIALSALSGLSAQQPSGCPDIDTAAREFIESNYPAEEGEKQKPIPHKIINLTRNVSALHVTSPGEGDEKDFPGFVAFFSGNDKCTFVQQYEGEIVDTIDVRDTKFVFLKTEDNEGAEHHAQFLVVTVKADGDVAWTRDQFGHDMVFTQSTQNRCEGKVGNITFWTRDTGGNGLVVRTRHTERDAKCRVTEDSSSYQYYRLTAELWELEDTEAEESVAGLSAEKNPMR